MKAVIRQRGRRTLATLGAVALGLIGMTGIANAAPSLGNIDPEATGTIYIDKFVTPDPAWETVANGKPITVPASAERLGGVVFEIVEVQAIGQGGSAVPLNLTTAAGWDAAAGLSATAVDTARHGTSNAYTFGTARTVTTSDTAAVPTSGLPIGLYLVHEISAGNNPITGPTAPTLVSVPYPDQSNSQWLYEIYLYPKNDVSGDETTKEVMDPPQIVLPDDGGVVTSDATVDWLIRVPVFTLGHENYTVFEVVDTLDPKLTYVDESAKVQAFTGVIANGTPQGDFGEPDDFAVVYDTTTNTVTISATPAGLLKLNNADGAITYIEITITTTVDGAGILVNDATSLVNDWESTIDPKPTTNWASLRILKYGGESTNNTLQGAEFKIFESRDDDGDGEDQVGGTYVTDEDGQINVVLWVGNNATVTKTYWIQEVKAPAGYVLPEGEGAWTQVTLTANAQGTVLVQPVANTQHEGPQLPITGANGQVLMMLGGAALALLGVGVALRSRKNARL